MKNRVSFLEHRTVRGVVSERSFVGGMHFEAYLNQQIAQLKLIPIVQQRRFVGSQWCPIQQGAVGASQVFDLDYVAPSKNAGVFARDTVFLG